MIFNRILTFFVNFETPQNNSYGNDVHCNDAADHHDGDDALQGVACTNTKILNGTQK